MILDILENGKNYVSLNDRFAEAFAFLAEKILRNYLMDDMR